MKKRIFLSLLPCLLCPVLAETDAPSQQLLSLSSEKEELVLMPFDHPLVHGYTDALSTALYDFRLDIHEPELLMEQLSKTTWGKSADLSKLFPPLGVKSIHLISSSNNDLLYTLSSLVPFWSFPDFLFARPEYSENSPYSRFYHLWMEKKRNYLGEKLKELELQPIILQIRLEENAPFLNYYHALLPQFGEPIRQGNGMTTWRLDALTESLPLGWRDADGQAKKLYLTLAQKDNIITAYMSSTDIGSIMLRTMDEEQVKKYTKSVLCRKGHFLSLHYTDILQDEKTRNVSIHMAKEALSELSQSDKEHAAEFLTFLRYLEKLEKQYEEIRPDLSAHYELEAWYDGDINLSFTVERDSLPSFVEGKKVIGDSLIDSPVTVAFAEISGLTPPHIYVNEKDIEEGNRAMMALGDGKDEKDVQAISGLGRVAIDLAHSLSFSGGIYATHDWDSVTGYLGLVDKARFLQGVGSEYKALAREENGKKYDLLGSKPCLIHDDLVFISNSVEYLTLLDMESKKNHASFTGFRAGVLFNKPTNLSPFDTMKFNGLEAVYMTIEPEANKLKGRVKLVLSEEK